MTVDPRRCSLALLREWLELLDRARGDVDVLAAIANDRSGLVRALEEAAQEMFEMMCDDGATVRHFPRLFSYLFRFSRIWPDWLYNRFFAK